MTVVTATLEDVNGHHDNAQWIFAVPQVRESGDSGAIVTTKFVRVFPVDGVLSVDLDPGFVVVSYLGKSYTIQVPTSGTPDLWDLLAAEVVFPPGNRSSDVATAISAFFTGNPYLSVDGEPVLHYDIDTTPATASDVGAYTTAEVDAFVAARVPLVGTAANGVQGVTAAPGAFPSLAATGPDTDISIGITPKAGGALRLGGDAPTIIATKSAATNLDLTVQPKGTGAFRIYVATGQTPTVKADGVDANQDLNLLSRGTGVVKANSIQVVTALVPTAVKTATYTAAVNDLIPADATSAGFTVTLPAAPADKSRISIKKIDSTANAVTVAAGGSAVFNKAGGSASLTLTLQNQAAQLQYAAATAIWYVVSTDVPLSGLDARYQNQPTTGNAGTATALATARKIDGTAFNGTADIVGTPARLLAPAAYVSGGYYPCGPPSNPSTSAALGFGVTRTIPWPVAVPLSVAKWFIEFTAAGDAASVFRIGVWNDDGFGRPGTLLLDAGTISTGTGNAGTVATAGTPGVYEITNALTVAPGLYHIGGAVQGSGTQPSIKTESTNIPFAGCFGTTLPSAGYGAIGYGAGSMVGAFTDTTALSLSGSAPRIGFKVA